MTPKIKVKVNENHIKRICPGIGKKVRDTLSVIQGVEPTVFYTVSDIVTEMIKRYFPGIEVNFSTFSKICSTASSGLITGVNNGSMTRSDVKQRPFIADLIYPNLKSGWGYRLGDPKALIADPEKTIEQSKADVPLSLLDRVDSSTQPLTIVEQARLMLSSGVVSDATPVVTEIPAVVVSDSDLTPAFSNGLETILSLLPTLSMDELTRLIVQATGTKDSIYMRLQQRAFAAALK